MSRYVVTGGAGFIGSNLSAYLVQQGHEVLVVDNLLTGRRENADQLGKSVCFVEGDVRDREAMTRLFRGADCVFHQAALPSVARSMADPWSCNDHNINGTLSVLISAAAAEVPRVVYAASSSAYGDSPVLPRVETTAPRPVSPYAVTKHVGELYCRVFAQFFKVETVSLRYFNVFGPRQNPDSEYAAVIPRFVTQLLRGEPAAIYGDGDQTRDFTYIENVTAANLAAATAPAARVSGQVFNIGCGTRVSLNQLLSELQSILGTNIAPNYLPARAGDVRDSLADISAATEAFGYSPRVDLREGLRRTIEWYRHLSSTSSGAVPPAAVLCVP